MLVLLCFSLAVVSVFANPVGENYLDDEIVVLYTNDVHNSINGSVNYASLLEFKELCQTKTPYVTMVDNGDAIQGDLIGSVSTGGYIVDIMNAVGYDLATLGNHEFDYTMSRLKELIKMAEYDYIVCNITYTGENAKNNALSNVKPYKIIEYGSTKVAYIGVATPATIVTSTPKYFMENGVFIYSFASGEDLISCVQGYVDEVRENGADYVIILSHLGEGSEDTEDTSSYLAANTSGIDAILDGHSHSVVEEKHVTAKDGKDVLISQTGSNFKNIGMLTIARDGSISTKLVQPTAKDPFMRYYVNKINEEFSVDVQKVIGYTEANLLRDELEWTMGNFVTDAYRYVMDADIAFMSNGCIRTNFYVGDVKYSDLVTLQPWANTIVSCEATGQQILDLLEMGCYTVTEENMRGNGGFQQVSGLKYKIDLTKETKVVLDEQKMFVKVDADSLDDYRVYDVFVGSDESGWEALDLDKTYTIAGINYMIQDGGDGLSMFMNNECLPNKSILDTVATQKYIDEVLYGVIPASYNETQGRIVAEPRK